MAIGIVTALRNTTMDAINAAINAGAGAGKCRIYNGSRPATGGAATTLLAELTLSDPASPGSASGVLTLSAITRDASADATGTATWFRVLDSNNAFVFDGSVTATGGGGDMELINVSLTAGMPVEISSFVLTEGNP